MPRAKKQELADEPVDVSLGFAKQALASFCVAKGRALKLVASERATKREALKSLRRVYEVLQHDYLRAAGTTYQGWLDHGPKADWDELTFAAGDDAIWDRLVDAHQERDHVA